MQLEPIPPPYAPYALLIGGRETGTDRIARLSGLGVLMRALRPRIQPRQYLMEPAKMSATDVTELQVGVSLTWEDAMPTRRTWRQAALLLALACTILALSCGLGSVAVRQGMVVPPNVNVELGSARVVGVRSDSPECTRLIIPGCKGLEPANAAHIYTLWLFRQSARDSWSQPNVTQLLSIRIGR